MPITIANLHKVRSFYWMQNRVLLFQKFILLNVTCSCFPLDTHQSFQEVHCCKVHCSFYYLLVIIVELACAMPRGNISLNVHVLVGGQRRKAVTFMAHSWLPERNTGIKILEVMDPRTDLKKSEIYTRIKYITWTSVEWRQIFLQYIKENCHRDSGLVSTIHPKCPASTSHVFQWRSRRRTFRWIAPIILKFQGSIWNPDHIY